MKFILHSGIDAASIRGSLGKSEYSYYFVLKAFLPAFERLGTVELVGNPSEDVDPIYEACAARGEDCVFVSFSPPHLVALGLKCPTVLVLAWEFSTLPDGNWALDDPRQDWRYVFSRLGCVISLSTHTADVVKAAMGEDFPIFAVPAPIHDRITDLARHKGDGVIRNRGAVFDSRDYDLSPDRILDTDIPFPPMRSTAWETAVEAPELERAKMRRAAEEADAARRAADEAARYRRSFRYRLAVTKRHLLEWYREAVRDLLPAMLVRFIGRVGSWGEASSRRLIGRSPAAPAVPPTPAAAPSGPSWPETEVPLGGVIYTTVLNPTDGRKNWYEIMTAFCWAFRDVEDATLVVKMVGSDTSAYRWGIFYTMCRLAPFKCRVVTIDGFLDEAEYGRLIGLTDYYVNASTAEGLCMPLMEFMSAGKPAIAPRHTAFADYVDATAAFVVASSPQLTVWPVDPAHRYSTMCERIHWDTLVAAFEQSYRLFKEARPEYSRMGGNAADAMRRYSSDEAVTARLQAVLRRILADGAGPAEETAAASIPPLAVATRPVQEIGAL